MWGSFLAFLAKETFTVKSMSIETIATMPETKIGMENIKYLNNIS